MILNNRKKQERISGLWIVALPRSGGWKDIEDVRLWHGEGCGRGMSFFVAKREKVETFFTEKDEDENSPESKKSISKIPLYSQESETTP